MSKKSKRRTKRNRVIANPDLISKENIENVKNAPQIFEKETLDTKKVEVKTVEQPVEQPQEKTEEEPEEKIEEKTEEQPEEQPKEDPEEVPEEEPMPLTTKMNVSSLEELTDLVDKLSFTPPRKSRAKQEEMIYAPPTDEKDTVEIYEQIGDKEVLVKDITESLEIVEEPEIKKESLKSVMEQAKTDLKNAGFPGFVGPVFDHVKGIILTPALDFSSEIVPPVANMIPFADEIGSAALGAIFGAIKFGYGVVPHKETTLPSQ